MDHRELEGIPDRADRARTALTAAEQTLARLHVDAAEIRDYLSHRPEIQAEIATIDDDLDHDLRTRSRVTRREQPTPIVAVLGVRPAHGQEALQWDLAAGELAQHQARPSTSSTDSDHGPTTTTAPRTRTTANASPRAYHHWNVSRSTTAWSYLTSDCRCDDGRMRCQFGAPYVSTLPGCWRTTAFARLVRSRGTSWPGSATSAGAHRPPPGEQVDRSADVVAGWPAHAGRHDHHL